MSVMPRVARGLTFGRAARGEQECPEDVSLADVHAALLTRSVRGFAPFVARFASYHRLAWGLREPDRDGRRESTRRAPRSTADPLLERTRLKHRAQHATGARGAVEGQLPNDALVAVAG